MQNVGKLSRENKYGTGFIRLTIRKSPSGRAGIRARARATRLPSQPFRRPAPKKKRKEKKTEKKESILTVLFRSAFFIPFD